MTCTVSNCPICRDHDFLPGDHAIVAKARFWFNVRRFWVFFAMQFVGYGLITWNIRAIGRGWIGNAVMSDLLIAALGFTLISKVRRGEGSPGALRLHLRRSDRISFYDPAHQVCVGELMIQPGSTVEDIRGREFMLMQDSTGECDTDVVVLLDKLDVEIGDHIMMPVLGTRPWKNIHFRRIK